MDFNSTVKGSALEGFYPQGWDFEKIDACIDAPEKILDRQAHWNKDFKRYYSTYSEELVGSVY